MLDRLVIVTNLVCQGGFVLMENSLDVRVVSIDLIEPNENQPRTKFDERDLRELMQSIVEKGIIQPLVVKPIGDKFQIIAGERRFRAARMAALKEVPVLVKNVSEQVEYEIALIENVQRSDLNVMELAVAYQSLMDEFDLSAEDIAVKIGKSRSMVANTVRLNQLSCYAQEKLYQEVINFGHAKAILSIKDKVLQDELVDEVIQYSMNVRDTEQRAKYIGKGTSKRNKGGAGLSPFYREAQETLQEVLGTKVTVFAPNKKGKIEIEYYSDEELEQILEIIKR
ncbi:MAG: hypothetical protein BEN19_00625 [Epulopiscium sp. Nuni2H_MBin003]|nr:MAG: hypothetical protein BEN19_00625 [Epulopiscium sp. Nuni2H_MBin003]